MAKVKDSKKRKIFKKLYEKYNLKDKTQKKMPNIRNVDWDSFTKDEKEELINSQIIENNIQRSRWSKVLILAIIFLSIGIALIPTTVKQITNETAYIAMMTIGILSLFIGFAVLVLVLGFLIYYGKYNKYLSAPELSDEESLEKDIENALSSNWADKNKDNNSKDKGLSEAEIDKLLDNLSNKNEDKKNSDTDKKDKK